MTAKRDWKNPGHERWDEDLTVTPEIAEFWLDHTSDKQGKVKQGLVDRYAFMRRSGLWDETNESPIKLDTKHEIIDGKHRLWMVVETGMPTRFHIHYNVRTEVYDTTDQGRARTLADVGWGDFKDSSSAAVSRAMAKGVPSKFSNRAAACLPLMREFQERHEEAIKFALAITPTSKRGISATVKGCIARAYYHAPHHELRMFADRLTTGVVADEGEIAALQLRDWLAAGARTRNGSGQSETYLKTARAIERFIARDKGSRLYAAQGDPFPLPE